jgi:hypothetical protein
MWVAALVLLPCPRMKEVAQWAMVLRPTVSVRCRNNNIRWRNTGKPPGLRARQICEITGHGAKIVANENERRCSILDDHRFGEERIVNSGADQFAEPAGATPSHGRRDVRLSKPCTKLSARSSE